MKKFMLAALLVGALGFTSCGSDDDGGSAEGNDDCVTCAAYEIQGQSIPAQEVCEGENGNAFLGSQDTDFPFATYILAQELLTTCE